MPLSNEEKILSEKSFEFIRENRRLIIDKFSNPAIYPKLENPSTIFMAGSPGAGKTEFAEAAIKELIAKYEFDPIVHIDADKIRTLIPQYNGKNSFVVQRAASKGVDLLYDFAQDNRLNILLDGTFSNYELAKKDVDRAVNKNRLVYIFYLFQDPYLAWKITQRRSILDGRYLPKEEFIKAFFNSKENVNNIKKEYKKLVNIVLIEKNAKNEVYRTKINIDNIDNHLKFAYNEKALLEDL